MQVTSSSYGLLQQEKKKKKMWRLKVKHSNKKR